VFERVRRYIGSATLKSGTDEDLRRVAFLLVLVPSVEGPRLIEGGVGRDALGIVVLNAESSGEVGTTALVEKERV
jgi:hypothetical protein